MPHAAFDAVSFIAATGLVLAMSVMGAEAQALQGADAMVLERALRLLPARPALPIRLIDPELAADPDAIRRLDAFVARERSGRLRQVIYLNCRAALFEKARVGGDLDIAILAAVIHHELAHLRGAGEPEARRSERDFFQSLILFGRVPAAEGRRYLADVERARHQAGAS